MDKYQQKRKEQVIETLSEMGMDTFQVQDLLEHQCVWENSMDLITQVIGDPNYVNVLRGGQQLYF